MIDRILERLEEKRSGAENEMHRMRDGDYALPCSFDRTDIEEIASESFKEAIEIVQEVAKEYGKDTNVRTNADCIRAMSDEELASLFGNFIAPCIVCIYRKGMCVSKDYSCDDGILKWLKSEVKE